MIRVVSDWHEIAQLRGKPVVEQVGVSSDKVATDKDVQHTSNERQLLPKRDSLGIIPSRTESVNRIPHPLPVLVQLFVWRRQAPPPFFYNSVFGVDT